MLIKKSLQYEVFLVSRVSAMATRHSDYSVKDGSISNGGVPTRQTRRGIEPHPNIKVRTEQTNNTEDI